MASDVTSRSQRLEFVGKIVEFVVGLAIGAFGAWALSFPVYSLPGNLSVWGEAIPPVLMTAVAAVLYLKSNLKSLAVGIVLGAIAETIFFVWLFAQMGGMP